MTDQALPAVHTSFDEARLDAELKVEGNRLLIAYEPLFLDDGFVRPEVMAEFGARATGEPREERSIQCDAAPHLTDIAFPSVRPHVMLAERTFWEKATAAHVFCRQQRVRGERLSRHWYDLVRLDETDHGVRALADHDLALTVAHHKALFFRENAADGRVIDYTAGRVIDYTAAVSGDLQLVPEEPALEVLADDYARMVAGGMLLDDAEEFETIMELCASIQARANG